ncbi:MAG TPA: ABC transporter permease [Gemmatimonadales bacterium]|nr:ABC transporter permease [Gemmatimonadales bacterium]
MGLPDASALPGVPALPPGPASAVVRVAPAGAWPGFDLPELWRYRGLLFFLVWREIKVRYAQTVLGAAWAILQPLLTTVVFTVIFGRFARLPSDGVPYPLFSLAALVPWTYFNTAVSGASNSLTANTSLVTKVYFPRLVIPGAAVLAALLDLAVSIVALLVLMLFYHAAPRPAAVVLVPLSVLMMVLTAAGMGFWLAALNIQYRDVKYVVPFLLQLWMFASPVVYPLSLVPDRYRLAYSLNPLAGAIAGFRSALLGAGGPTGVEFGVSLGMACLIFVGGAAYFRRTERVFADVA